MNYINYFQQQAALPEGTLPPSQEANELGLPLSEFIEAMTMADFQFFSADGVSDPETMNLPSHMEKYLVGG
jgi:hypothetical protein